MTINKSQGQTFNRALIVLPTQVFSHGQLYVALSRVGAPDGLRVAGNFDADNQQIDSTPGLPNNVKNVVWKEVL
jgi:ATP-dependent DNA helicase PIF1